MVKRKNPVSSTPVKRAVVKKSTPKKAVVKKSTPKKAVAKKSTPKKAVVKKTKTKKKCFTIMPFGGWFDDYYETIYVPAIEKAGFDANRADDLYRPSTIVTDIWSMTQEATIVLADLTGKNPNVFYELGLAHAIAKPVVLVTETMDDVPFDLRALRILEYDKNLPNWGNKLQQDITKSINEIFESPLEAVLPAFLKVNQRSTIGVSDAEKEILELRQDMDLLRREVRLRPIRSERPTILENPSDAREWLKRNLNRYSRSTLVRKALDMGVPSSWIEDELDEILMAS